MDNLEKPPRASWLRPRLRRYEIKERPKSWAPGNYRKLVLNEDANTQPKAAARQSMPPAPPVRSSLTRLQTIPSLTQMEPMPTDKIPENKSKTQSTEKVQEDYSAEMDKNEAKTKRTEGNKPTEEEEFSLLI